MFNYGFFRLGWGPQKDSLLKFSNSTTHVKWVKIVVAVVWCHRELQLHKSHGFEVYQWHLDEKQIDQEIWNGPGRNNNNNSRIKIGLRSRVKGQISICNETDPPTKIGQNTLIWNSDRSRRRSLRNKKSFGKKFGVSSKRSEFICLRRFPIKVSKHFNDDGSDIELW